MRLNNVSKTYRVGGEGGIKALNGVGFEMPENGMVFIIGKSGSGKTTLLNIMSGIDVADEGSEIEVCGEEIVRCGEKERAAYRNTCCGFVFQEYNLIPELNVKDNILLATQLQGKKDSENELNAVLQSVGLEGYGNRKISELSGGQKQRVAIARAVIKAPRIIFADEPTGALDEETGEQIFELLKKLSQDRLVITVSHDKESAEKYGDRIIELADGKVVHDSGGAVERRETRMERSKPRMPIKSAFKIGCANFKRHPIRLAATILLSVIAFTFLGVTLASALNTYENIVYNAIISDGTRYSAVNKYATTMGGAIRVPIKFSEYAEIDADTAIGVVAVRDGIESDNYGDNVYDGALPIGYVEITAELVEVCGFTVYGSLPQNENELCLTSFSADILNRLNFGKKDVSAVIGERIVVDGRAYTVSGVIDTHFDENQYVGLKSESSGSASKLAEAYATELATSVHNIMFVSDISVYFDNAVEFRGCSLTAAGMPAVNINKIIGVPNDGSIYMLGSDGDGYISINDFLAVLYGAECNVEYNGKRYYNCGELFAELANGNYGKDNVIGIYELCKSKYGFPSVFSCTLKNEAFDFARKITVNGIAFDADDGTFVANGEFYNELYGMFGGEFDTVIVDDSPAVKRYIAGDGKFKLANRTVVAAEAYRGTIDAVKYACGICSAVFAVFAAALLLNFLLRSFTDKLKTLGVLKANGASIGGLVKIFACEAAAIGVAVLVLSCALTVIICACANSYLGVAFFGASHVGLPIMIACILVLVGLCCVLPTIKAARMSPIDIINNGD